MYFQEECLDIVSKTELGRERLIWEYNATPTITTNLRPNPHNGI